MILKRGVYMQHSNKKWLALLALCLLMTAGGVLGAVVLRHVIYRDSVGNDFLFPIFFPNILLALISVHIAKSVSGLFVADLFYAAAVLLVNSFFRINVLVRNLFDIFTVLLAIFIGMLLLQGIMYAAAYPFRVCHRKALINISTDENGVILVSDNSVLARRIALGVLIVFSAFVNIAVLLDYDIGHGDFSDLKIINIEESEKYADIEVGQAASKLIQRFWKDPDSKLIKLYYHSDDGKRPQLLDEYNERYPDRHITGVIVFYTEFVGLTDTGASMKGDRFHWTWTYARSDDEDWELMNYGW